jgi:hypothetical protein
MANKLLRGLDPMHPGELLREDVLPALKRPKPRGPAVAGTSTHVAGNPAGCQACGGAHGAGRALGGRLASGVNPPSWSSARLDRGAHPHAPLAMRARTAAAI